MKRTNFLRAALVGLVCGFFGLSSMVQAASNKTPLFNLRALGGINLGMVSYSDTAETNPSGSGPLTYQFGGGIELRFSPIIGLAIDGFWMNKNLGLKSDGFDLKFNYNQLLVPATLMIHPTPWLYLGAGYYYAAAMGDIHATGTSGGTAVDETVAFGDTDIAKNHHGPAFNLGFMVPFSPNFGLLVDGRFLIGLNDLSTESDNSKSIKSMDILVSAGLQIGF